MATNVLKSTEYEVPDSSIWEYLVEILEKEPDRVLLINGTTGQRVTCRHLVAEVEIYASALMSIGMNVGDTVCAYLPNTIDHIVLQLACFASGITYTGAYQSYPKRELTQVVKVSKSKVLFCYRENIDVAVDVADEVGHVQRLIVADDSDYPTATPGGKDISSLALLRQAGVISNFKLPVISDPKATSSLMLFSSGSTGTPKGVLRNHYQVICTMVKIGICHIYGPPGSVISGHQAPQHLSGNFNILSTIVCRLTMVVESSFDCDTFLRSVQLYKITTGLLTPSNAIAITKRHELSAEYDVSSLKDCVCGGSCFPDSAKDNLRRAFQLSSLRQMYGSTELGICAFTNIGETDSNYVGILAPGYEMRIHFSTASEMLSEKYETVIDEHKVVRNKITCRPTPQVSLARYLFDHLEKEPERVLFIDAPTGQEWKRGQTKDEVVKMAKVLLSRGLVEGDRFCVFAPNTMTHIILQIAAFATNICYAGCYATYSARELEHILTILEAKALFIYEDKYEIAISVAGKIPSLKHIVILDSTEDICRKVGDDHSLARCQYGLMYIYPIFL
ncbi:Luciferin 4-monooxygenase [Halotydeus destructor]|nr:Luciferin 4-monooxygenase [Halotydeus destructor]